MWFKKLTGFSEESPQQIRKNLLLDGDTLTSKITGKSFTCGTLSTPSLGELRQQTQNIELAGQLSVSEIIADVQDLHIDTSNADSLFQVASQFNLLEMVSPDISPESGIDGYENDHTQGPACAIAAGAGTIYRNYFVSINGKQGQSLKSQIDTLFDMGQALGNEQNTLWQMRNGYALASEAGLQQINNSLKCKTEAEIDELRQLLRVGIQQNTEVTISPTKHKVSQIYCSALPVGYSQHSVVQWQAFASLVLVHQLRYIDGYSESESG